MNEVIFVTHNKGKIASAKERLEEIDFKIFEYELEEPRSDDIKYISKYKVMESYKLVNKPCISLDCGFWIDELNGFPRAFVNFTLDTIGIEGILKLMEGKQNRKCRFTECLSYYDGKELQDENINIEKENYRFELKQGKYRDMTKANENFRKIGIDVKKI